MTVFLRLCRAVLFVLLGFQIACAPTVRTAEQMAQGIPFPTPEISAALTGQMLWDLFPATTGTGPWHAFAAAKYDQPRGGTPATVVQVVKDLKRSNPKVFRSHIARTQFIRAMIALHPEVSNINSLIAVLSDPSKFRIVACEGKVETLAYNGQGGFKRIVRDCVAGEQKVEFNVAGTWVKGFILGCLNPENAPVFKVVEDMCPVTWKVPTGSAPDGRNTIVFVPAEAIHCLPPASECDDECVDWMKGYRGSPDNPRIEAALGRMVNGGGSAFRLMTGVTEIRLPAAARTSSEYAAWCDRRKHGSQEAFFIRVN